MLRLVLSRRHYRLTKRGVLQLTDLLVDHLNFSDDRGSPLTPLQQTCLTLGYLGGGTFQHTAGLIGGASKSCSNMTIARVIEAVCQISPDYISLPSRQEMRETSQFFFDRFEIHHYKIIMFNSILLLQGLVFFIDLVNQVCHL